MTVTHYCGKCTADRSKVDRGRPIGGQFEYGGGVADWMTLDVEIVIVVVNGAGSAGDCHAMYLS